MQAECPECYRWFNSPGDAIRHVKITHLGIRSVKMSFVCPIYILNTSHSGHTFVSILSAGGCLARRRSLRSTLTSSMRPFLLFEFCD